ncbi:hypothetical protein J4441_05300 [Candidatus Micrarchaeota archaeon]|nr:hypothetical protein [Candidatus Micrarchaeota archaeon]
MSLKLSRTRKGLGALGARLLSTISAEKRSEIFTIKDAEEALGAKGPKLRKLLFDLRKNKWIGQVERGKYLMLPLESGSSANYGTHPYIIARKLISPYYVGFASALNYYGITEQVGRTTYISTTKAKRKLAFASEVYRFVRLPKARFFGFTEEWIGDLKFNISDREKTVIDCLYMPQYSGGLTEVAKAFRKELDYEKLYKYACDMDDMAVIKRLGCLLEDLMIKTSIIERLLRLVGGGYCLLDPSGPKTGRQNRKWRVIENIPKEELRMEL